MLESGDKTPCMITGVTLHGVVSPDESIFVKCELLAELMCVMNSTRFTSLPSHHEREHMYSARFSSHYVPIGRVDLRVQLYTFHPPPPPHERGHMYTTRFISHSAPLGRVHVRNQLYMSFFYLPPSRERACVFYMSRSSMK